ncbi:MAG: hypothetical protein QM750_23220 [Rubrivivax sp.]
MANGDDPGSGMSDRSSLFAQAATSLVTSGLRQALGSSPAEQSMPDSSWIGRLLAPYRQVLGDWVGMLPSVLKRVEQVVDPAAGRQLLFRARTPWDPKASNASSRKVAALPRAARALGLQPAEQLLYKFIAAAHERMDKDHVLLTQGLRERLSALPDDLKSDTARQALQALVQDERRLDLPRMLDELKHQVRANRASGFIRVRNALQWLLQSEGQDFGPGYALLEALTDILGENCLRELLRRRVLIKPPSLATADEKTFESLRTGFRHFGHELSDLLSVVGGGSAERPTLLVLDHGHDRHFELQADGSSQRTSPCAGFEVYGPHIGRDYRVRGQPVRLPMRIHDAAQGLATWTADKRAVQDLLDGCKPDSALDMRAWDVGANRTPVALYFIHHRDADVGPYFEVGLGAFVAPRRDPLSVGLTALGAILVSTREAMEVGQEVWGFDKEHVDAEHWDVRYRPDFLTCAVRVAGATLNLRLPRGGAMSSALPVLLYTRRPARSGGGQWHRSAMMRFASDESVRIAGAGVALSLTLDSAAADKDKPFAHSLLGALYGLGLIDPHDGAQKSNALHASWSEHVRAQLGPPSLVSLPEPDDRSA